MSYQTTVLGSANVNGQLVSQLPAGAIYPGPAIAPILRSVQGSPPPTIGSGLNAGQQQTAAAAASNPFDFRSSPIPLMLIMLIVGMLGLRFITFG